MYVVYKLSFENGDTYIGSSKNVQKRIQSHKDRCYREGYRHYPIYKCMRLYPDFEWEVLFEENCTEIVARQLEQQFINIHQPTLNCLRAFRTEEEKKEYREQNKEKIALQNKEWYEQNKEHISLKGKERYEKNKEQISLKGKEKITCECGSIVRKDSLLKHKKSKKHVKFIMATK